MSDCHRQSDRRLRISWAAFSIAPTVCTTFLGIFLLVVPMARSSENNERSSSNERCEELSMTGRIDRIRSLAIEYLRGTPLRAVAVIPNVGHAQRPDLDPPAGHRLANGLLAPLTC